METGKKQTKFTNYASFWATTMLTSKTIAEIIEEHSKLCWCPNSCNKFISNFKP